MPCAAWLLRHRPHFWSSRTSPINLSRHPRHLGPSRQCLSCHSQPGWGSCHDGRCSGVRCWGQGCGIQQRELHEDLWNRGLSSNLPALSAGCQHPALGSRCASREWWQQQLQAGSQQERSEHHPDCSNQDCGGESGFLGLAVQHCEGAASELPVTVLGL